MHRPHILLVEDEPHIAKGLVFNLECEGYRVTQVETASDALAAYEQENLNLIVLDLMLPDGSGLDVCRSIRKREPQLPILILTALSEEDDRVAGLQEGADDYLTKPFSLDEFLLRVQGILKRSGWYRPEPETFVTYLFGENLVDLGQLRASTPQGDVSLTDLEGKMLLVFFQNEGRVVSRSQLLKSVWGVSEDTQTRTLDNFVVRLRKYFEKDPSQPRYFQTVRGRGYRFQRDPEEDSS